MAFKRHTEVQKKTTDQLSQKNKILQTGPKMLNPENFYKYASTLVLMKVLSHHSLDAQVENLRVLLFLFHIFLRRSVLMFT